MTNIRLAFWGLLPLFAVLLAPTDAWEASTSQNLSITVTANTATNAFYVATDGKDTNPGTLAAPFATLQACQTAMRNSSTVKTCYIRAGIYTGGGHGYNAVTTAANGGWQTNESLYLTSSDNGEFFGEYPPDFPSNGISSATFDGQAGAWSSRAGAASGCVTNANPTTAMGYGVYINGGSNITIDRLHFQNFCHGGIGIHGGIERSASCLPITTATAASGNTISNNYIHAISSYTSQCAGDFVGGTGGINLKGNTPNTTITHNVVFNVTGNGIITVANEVTGVSGESLSNTIADHNVVYSVNTIAVDRGGIVFNDLTGGTTSTNLKLQYNYVHNWGGAQGYSAGSPGQSNKALYNDDGNSNTTKTGNVVFGIGTQIDFQHGGTNENDTGNIFDMGNPGAACGSNDTCTETLVTQNPGAGTPSGTMTFDNNIIIANTASCGQGLGQCTIGNGWSGTLSTTGGNIYWNYGSGGNSILTTDASNNGEVNPKAIDAFGNATTRCPGGNLNSWGFVIPAGNGVFSNGFPAQPAGWATPGFWGPPGFVPPHDNNPPSYGPTC
jgi:hypothetical protein